MLGEADEHHQAGDEQHAAADAEQAGDDAGAHADRDRRRSSQHELDRACHEHGGEQQRDRARCACAAAATCRSARRRSPARRRGSRRARARCRTAPASAAAKAAMKTIAASDVPVAAALVVAEPQDQQRDDHAAAADAEQAAEDPGRRADRHQLQRALRARLDAHCGQADRLGQHARHTSRRVPRRDARGGARADALRPRRGPPCCSTSTARSRRSSARRRRACARGDAHAADRDLQALPPRRLRQRTPCRDARARSSRSARSPTSATTAASSCARARRGPRSTPSSQRWTERVREFAARVLHQRASAPARAQRGQGRDRRLPLAWRPRRAGGRACGRARSRSARRTRALPSTGGARCSRCARRWRSTRASASRALLRRRRRSDAALYVGDDTTDLDAFRGLRELVASGKLERASASRSAPRKRRRSSPQEADLTVDGPAGVRELLEALL